MPLAANPRRNNIFVEHAPEGQPIRPRLLRAMLGEAGNPELDLPRDVEEGAAAGILFPMPRSPEVYEQQTNRRLEEDASPGTGPEAGNYSSAEVHRDWLRSRLADEVERGRIVRCTKQELRDKYGRNYATASLAVLQSSSCERRLVHDGTRTVAINNKIGC